jgi:hypothetical protein
MATSTLNDVQMASIPMDAMDKMTMKLAVLHANLMAIQEDGLANFDGMSPELRGNYLYGCAELVRDCIALTR